MKPKIIREFAKRLEIVRARREALTKAIVAKGVLVSLPSLTEITIDEFDFHLIPTKEKGEKKMQVGFYFTLRGLEKLAEALDVKVPR